MQKRIEKDTQILVRTTKDIAEFLKRQAAKKNTSVNELTHYVLMRYKRNTRVKKTVNARTKA